MYYTWKELFMGNSHHTLATHPPDPPQGVLLGGHPCLSCNEAWKTLQLESSPSLVGTIWDLSFQTASPILLLSLAALGLHWHAAVLINGQVRAPRNEETTTTTTTKTTRIEIMSHGHPQSIQHARHGSGGSTEKDFHAYWTQSMCVCVSMNPL